MSVVRKTAASMIQNIQQLEKQPLIFTVFLASLLTLGFFFLISNHRKRASLKTPPGALGWPLIGETLEFLGCQRRGNHFPCWPSDCGVLHP
jgi:hypothetical protein